MRAALPGCGAQVKHTARSQSPPAQNPCPQASASVPCRGEACDHCPLQCSSLVLCLTTTSWFLHTAHWGDMLSPVALWTPRTDCTSPSPLRNCAPAFPISLSLCSRSYGQNTINVGQMGEWRSCLSTSLWSHAQPGETYAPAKASCTVNLFPCRKTEVLVLPHASDPNLTKALLSLENPQHWK